MSKEHLNQVDSEFEEVGWPFIVVTELFAVFTEDAHCLFVPHR